MLGSCLEINLYNASSFACDSLLRDYPFELASHGFVIRIKEKEISAFKHMEHEMDDDILINDPTGEMNKYKKVYGPAARDRRGPRYHFYYQKDTNGKLQKKAERIISWEDQLPILAEKLKKRIVKEFKRNFVVGPQIFVRKYSTIISTHVSKMGSSLKDVSQLYKSWPVLSSGKVRPRINVSPKAEVIQVSATDRREWEGKKATNTSAQSDICFSSSETYRAHRHGILQR